MMAQEMNKLYYYLDKSMQQIGPMRQEELLTLKQTGTISEKTLVWTEGLEKWVPLSTQLSPDETNASVKENPKRRHNTPTGTHQKRSGTSRTFLTFLGIVALVGIVGLVIIWGKTAKQASAEELFQEGRRYAKQDDYASAVAKFRAAAEQGHARAQNNLGCCYAEGQGVAQDLEQAVSWLHKAAEQGDAIAQFNLGGHYASGQGVVQDWDQAVFWYRKAAEQGQARAQNNLGCYYAEGQGVAQDWDQAVSWWRKAAEQGLPAAQYNLGGCYAGGQGVALDLNQAVSWFRKAAEQGHAYAQYDLGCCYADGQGVAQDWDQAVSWCRKAAEQGLPAAQYNLGGCYYNGTGTNVDYSEAARWFSKAEEGGIEDARRYYDLAIAQLKSASSVSKAELSNAEKLQRIRIAAVSFEDTPIEDALDFLRAEGRKAGIPLNIVFFPSGIPPCIPQLHLTNVTAEDFLKNICSVTKCELRIEANAVIISSNGGADYPASYNNEDEDDIDF